MRLCGLEGALSEAEVWLGWVLRGGSSWRGGLRFFVERGWAVLGWGHGYGWPGVGQKRE